jgi:hypothetical protein
MALLSLDVICGGPAAALIGIPSGLAGIFQKRNRKLFAVLGLTFNTLYILSLLILYFIIVPAIAQY